MRHKFKVFKLPVCMYRYLLRILHLPLFAFCTVFCLLSTLTSQNFEVLPRSP